MNAISPYKVTWIEFIPETGMLTKHDERMLNPHYFKLYPSPSREYLRCHFPSKEKALEYIKTFKKQLDKRYKCLLFTDKQFGMATKENGYKIPCTKAQLEEVYYLEKNLSPIKK